ncbi:MULTISPECIES: hypothetical protein [Bacillus cereus group]|uniref:hypothetical protein n=1 Tax=Bacillus cereus group TaxID=86661 RepID=UPI00086436C7|nr:MULTISPECIES: hypothetical protein [Bacillus cereus group]AWC29092.1 hypothetical protein CG483_012635 [Bacillus cytotoxicus]AWC39522.1 hypothetical protein CG480_002615 [Bacillus cytotoxicus]AWC47453.1 hypothetical protein CG478_002615 [Bacillus cytotoxicus]AWC53163.1 hypothetical protein CG477_012595 [Bacillus cytotoxicus]AWC57292.1 hypothetical protein CG476_012620 [Bacillus cytotoxicus]
MTAIECVGKSDRGAFLWKFKCDCGNEVVKEGRTVKRGDIKSCGCLVVEHAKYLNYSNGFGRTKLYGVYKGILDRCNNPENKSFKDYGGRGIKVIEEWEADYLVFMEWALANGYKDGLSIDRIDVNKGYSPENCRWATRDVQANNKRNTILINYKGKTQSLKRWCKELNLNYYTIHSRITRNNYSYIDALEKPIKYRKEETK